MGIFKKVLVEKSLALEKSWKKKMDRISLLCEGTGTAGQESVLACGLAFINS